MTVSCYMLLYMTLLLNRELVSRAKLCLVVFLPARRYASAGNSDHNVSVRPSVRLSVHHVPVLCQNEES